MSHALFRAKLREIVADIGGPNGEYRTAICEEANALLRTCGIEGRPGAYLHFLSYWMDLTDEDFAVTVPKLEEHFTTQTTERTISVTKIRGGRAIERPSAIWLEGKKYRLPLARCWSALDHRNELIWAAEITPFARVSLGASRYMTAAERKRFQADVPSEHLAEKAMKQMFENVFRTTLGIA